MEPLEKVLIKVRSLYKGKKYTEVIDLLPDKLLEAYQSADLYVEKARAFLKSKEIEQGNKLIDIALKIEANNAIAVYYKGVYYEERNEHDKALEFYNIAISINPKFSYPFNALGNIYSDQKKYNEAIEFYKKAIKIAPKDPYPYNGLGHTYNDLKNYDEAIKFFNKAVNIDPEFSSPYNGLGNTYSILKKYDQAIEFYNKAIKTDPQDPNPYNGLGIIYRNIKKYNDAIKYYNKAIKIDSTISHPYFNRAQTLYHNLLKYQEALLDYEQFIKLADNKYDDYYIEASKSYIEELGKLIKSSDYSSINELVIKIKDLLSFKDGCITHYTSLSTAKKFVSENGRFRLSEGTFLNDTSEGSELFRFLNYKTGVMKNNDTIATRFSQKPFIGSFVAETKHDDLTLWRMYGKEEKEEAKGCAITIDMKGFLENIKTSLSSSPDSYMDEEFRFYKVAYRESEKKFVIPGETKKTISDLNKLMTQLQSVIEEFKPKKQETQQNVTELLNQIAYLFKSIEYLHENEVRLVLKGIGFEKNFDISPKVFIELVSLRPLIKKITIGPKVEKADEWAAAFHYSLDKDDLHPEILISHLPFK